MMQLKTVGGSFRYFNRLSVKIVNNDMVVGTLNIHRRQPFSDSGKNHYQFVPNEAGKRLGFVQVYGAPKQYVLEAAVKQRVQEERTK
jgi:hypothetical protein